MFRKFLFSTLAITICATALLFYYEDITINKKDYQSTPHLVHPNLVKESALILDLETQGIELISLGKKGSHLSIVTLFNSHTFFDMDNDGFSELISWTNGEDGFLVYDINKNGKIESQSELFGKDIKNRNGFLKLMKLDNNKDGVISESDLEYKNLKVWIDINNNGLVNDNELKDLNNLHIEKIYLTFDNTNSERIADNPVRYKGKFLLKGGEERNIQDIELQKSNALTHYRGGVALDVSTLFLPTLKGFGNLPDLHIAASKDNILLDQLKNISKSLTNNTDETLKNADNLKSNFDGLLFRWAECDRITKDARGPFVNAQHLIFIEKLTGSRYGEEASYPYDDPQNKQQGDAVEKSFRMAAKPQMSFLINQIIAPILYNKQPSYNVAIGEISNGHLSLEGINYLEKLASSLPLDKRKNFWVSMINIILPVKKQHSFEADENFMLNEAISRTLPTESLQAIIIEANNI
jgi:hypothetical protein